LRYFVELPEGLLNKPLREFTKVIFAALSLNHSLRDILSDNAWPALGDIKSHQSQPGWNTPREPRIRRQNATSSALSFAVAGISQKM
jgi:hypothetical protein